MSKGDETRAQVLSVAVDIASERGLESLTIGTLAERAGLSKSGLYAHFVSKEDLQCQVLDAAADKFIELVITPAFAAPRGLPRIESLTEYWMRWEAEALPGGCPFISSAAEYDDREGPVRDRVALYLGRMREAIVRAADIAVEEGHFSPTLNTRHYAFEFWGIVLAYQQYVRLMEAPDARSLALSAFGALNDRSKA